MHRQHAARIQRAQEVVEERAPDAGPKRRRRDRDVREFGLILVVPGDGVSDEEVVAHRDQRDRAWLGDQRAKGRLGPGIAERRTFDRVDRGDIPERGRAEDHASDLP